MSHYLELTVFPDEEINVSVLMEELYGKLHLTLARQQVDSIGVSFPGYCLAAQALGSVLRLHGAEETLKILMANDWLKGLRDYVRLAPITSVPVDAEHRTIYRKQFKTNVERLRRRRMKRKEETVEEVIKAIPDEVVRRPDLPYVWMRSRSTKQRFCLFIGMSPPRKTPASGRFSCYGLSNEATIPWFYPKS